MIMSNINSKIKIINLYLANMMKPSGTSTPLNIIQDSSNISSSTSPSLSSSINFYDDLNNNKTNKPVVHNYTTTTSATTSSIINNDTDIDDDEYDYEEGKNEYTSSHTTDDSDDSNNNINDKLYICNIDNHNQYYIVNTTSNLYNNNSRNIKFCTNNNNIDYYDEFAYKKASIELFLTKFKKLVNDFIRANQNVTRDNLVQQTVNDNKCDYIFADSKKIEKLKSYGNKIYDLFSSDLHNTKSNDKDDHIDLKENRFVDPVINSKKIYLNMANGMMNINLSKMNKLDENIVIKKSDHDRLINDLNKLKEECEHYRRDKKIRERYQNKSEELVLLSRKKYNQAKLKLRDYSAEYQYRLNLEIENKRLNKHLDELLNGKK